MNTHTPNFSAHHMGTPAAQRELVRKVWNDPETGFVGSVETRRRAIRAAKEAGLPFTLDSRQVQEVLNEEDAWQLNASRKRVKTFAKHQAKGVNHKHQSDLIDLDKDGFGVFQGLRYLFTITDVYSRLSVAVPIPDKKAATVLKAWQAILESEPYNGPKFRPEVFSTDAGGEFARLSEYADKLGIQHREEPPGVHTRLAIANRFHKTLEQRLATAVRATTGKKTGDWTPLLEPIMVNYNTGRHRSLKATPAAVYTGQAQPHREGGKAVQRPLSEQEKRLQRRLNIGTWVRLRTDFADAGNPLRDRAFFERWSDERFVISLQRTDKKTGLERYGLWEPETNQTLDNLFYANELLPIPAPKKKTKGKGLTPPASPQEPEQSNLDVNIIVVAGFMRALGGDATPEALAGNEGLLAMYRAEFGRTDGFVAHIRAVLQRF